MIRFLKLSMILFKNSLAVVQKKGKAALIKQLLFAILIFIAFMPLISGIVLLIWNGYDLFASFGQQGLLLGLGVPAICFTIFFFGIFYVINTFYFSQDIDSLLPLPFRPWEILSAKFVVVTIYEYLTVLVLMLPIIITFGIKGGEGIIYYIYSAIIFFTLPILPLVISSLIVILIMRYTNISRYKERFKLFGGIFAVIIGLGLNIFCQRAVRSVGDGKELLKLLTQGNNSLLNIGNGIFPSARFVTQSLINSGNSAGIINLLIYLGLSVAVFILLILISEGMYFKGVMGVSEAPSKRKNLSDLELSNNTKENSAVWSYAIKEIKLLVRTPIYFINCILMNFLWPIILIFVFAQPNSKNNLKALTIIGKNPQYAGIAFAVIIALALFIASTNGISASAISREGEGLYICKYIPMSYKEQLISKIIPSIIMGGVAVIILLIMVVFIYSPSILMLLMLLITSVFGILIISFSGILLDVNFPKLHWTNEQKAVKQNLNVMLNMLIGTALAGGTIFTIIKLELSLMNAFLLTIIVFALITYLLFRILLNTGAKVFRNLES